MVLPTPKATLLAIPVLCLQGCLSSWIRLEDGTVLAPGRSEFGVALASAPRVQAKCVDSDHRVDSLGRETCVRYRYGETEWGGLAYSIDTLPERTIRTRDPDWALAWRLGVLGPFGPFTGLELGIHAEFPTNPVSQEFRLALGLPGSDSLRAHSLLAGWGTGMWADDNWFLQYAASRRFGRCRVFGSLRATLQATQLEDALDGDRFHHKRSWDVQSGVGARFDLGSAKVVPDWLVVGATADYSHAGLPEIGASKQVDGFGVAWTSAMGWTW